MARMRMIVVGALLASSLMLSGCKKKKPPVPAPQAQAPTIESTDVPAVIPEVPVPEQPEPTAPPPTVAKKPKPKPPVKKAPPATEPAPEKKIVVEEGGKQEPPPPPLVADNSQDSVQQRQATAQLVQSTEYNISSITRQLSADEQAIVRHIRGFLEESKQATKDGDTQRAYNLAIKAHLLSDSLKK